MQWLNVGWSEWEIIDAGLTCPSELFTHSLTMFRHFEIFVELGCFEVLFSFRNGRFRTIATLNIFPVGYIEEHLRLSFFIKKYTNIEYAVISLMFHSYVRLKFANILVQKKASERDFVVERHLVE